MTISSPTTTIAPPYLLFLGDATDALVAKTAAGVLHWRPELCAGQMRLPGGSLDLGLPDMELEQALAAGIKSLVIGVAPAGGELPPHWVDILADAAARGLDIVSGLHGSLRDSPALAAAAASSGCRLTDLRRAPTGLPVATGMKRPGRRLLTVGSDCAVGKKFTALALDREMQARGMQSTFRATGQTGILIAGAGIAIDAVVADFIAGAAECLSPANESAHWDVVEGQGALLHPAYSGVSLGLLHGTQPDAVVLCHDPRREHIYICPEQRIPPLTMCLQRVLELGGLTNPAIRAVGVSVNLSGLPAVEHAACLARIEDETGLPCTDPVLHGVGAIVDHLQQIQW